MTDQQESIISETNFVTFTKWEVLNDLEQAFSKVTTLQFMSERLLEAIEDKDLEQVIVISKSIDSFLPVFTSNFDEKFSQVWKKVILEEG